MRSYFLKNLAILFVILVSITACGGGGNDAASASEVRTEQKSTEVKLEGFAIGNFIESETFAVGGQGDRFKATDYLYATISLSNPTPGDQLEVAVDDQSGHQLLKKSSIVNSPDQTTLNIDLDIHNPKILNPGTYTFKVFLNNQLASSHQIIIE